MLCKRLEMWVLAHECVFCAKITSVSQSPFKKFYCTIVEKTEEKIKPKISSRKGRLCHIHHMQLCTYEHMQIWCKGHSINTLCTSVASGHVWYISSRGLWICVVNHVNLISRYPTIINAVKLLQEVTEKGFFFLL